MLKIPNNQQLLQFVMLSMEFNSLLNIMLVVEFYKIIESKSSVVEFLQARGLLPDDTILQIVPNARETKISN